MLADTTNRLAPLPSRSSKFGYFSVIAQYKYSPETGCYVFLALKRRKNPVLKRVFKGACKFKYSVDLHVGSAGCLILNGIGTFKRNRVYMLSCHHDTRCNYAFIESFCTIPH